MKKRMANLLKRTDFSTPGWVASPGNAYVQNE
jgi:hypothetical protein